MQNSVLVYDKVLKKHYKKQIYRQYESYGKVPLFDPNNPKSYMFSGTSTKIGTKTIPEEYIPYIDQIKSLDARYNQFVINIYNDGNDYIEPHSDCDKDMIDDYRILILSIGETRTLRLTSRKNNDVYLDIDLHNNSIFKLDKDLNSNYRHEILKSDTTNRRISITARMMK